MFQIADLVVSVSGRDKNRIFMVVDIPEEGYVLIADGALRKLEKPKKKKDETFAFVATQSERTNCYKNQRRKKTHQCRASKDASGSYGC